MKSGGGGGGGGGGGVQSASGPIRKVGGGGGGACRTMIYILVCARARDSAWRYGTPYVAKLFTRERAM